MAQTYNQIQRQIQQLQRQAAVLRNAEIRGVVERIKVAIEHYGLTAEQLGLASSGKTTQTIKAPAKNPARTSTGAVAKFSDGSGNVWSGHGSRPRWLRDALDSGRNLEEFRVDSRSQAAVPSPSTSMAAVAPASKKPNKANKANTAKKTRSKKVYRDEAGHTWSGMGPKPGWLKAAMEGGKPLEDFVK